MENKEILPVFLIDGFPQSGCSTLARLIANTYSLDLVDINDVIWKLFEQTPYAAQETLIAREQGFTEFLKKEIATTPTILEQSFQFVEEKMKSAKKPVLINSTGIIGYTITKDIPTLYRLFVQCEASERAERIYRKAKAPVSLPELDEMVKSLIDQDNLWSEILKKQFSVNIFHDEPEHKIMFINSSKTPSEQLCQQVVAQPEFEAAMKSAAAFLPEVGQEWNRWKCLVCGFTYEGAEHVTVCPKCKNADPDKFGDAE